MKRPNRKQWAVLWLGAIWVVLSLMIAEEYILRAVFGGLLITGLLFWQLSSADSPQEPSAGTGREIRPAEPPPVHTRDSDQEAAQQVRSDRLETLSSQIESAHKTGPTGIGGWLGLQIFGLVFGAPIILMASLALTARSVANPTAFLTSALYFGFLSGWSVYAGLALWNRWPRAVRIAKIAIVGSLIANFVAMASFAAAGWLTPEAAGQAAGKSLWPTLIWFAYLSRSKRVKNTFPSTTEAATDPAISRTKGLQIALAVAAVTISASIALETRANPLSLLRTGIGSDQSFDSDFLASLKTTLTKTFDEFSPSEMRVLSKKDLVSSFEVRSEYVGTALVNGIRQNVKGSLITYVHPTGQATIHAACFPDGQDADCSVAFPAAIETAATALLTNLARTDLDGILPKSPDCETEPTARQITCTYPHAFAIQFRRVSEVEAMAIYTSRGVK